MKNTIIVSVLLLIIITAWSLAFFNYVKDDEPQLVEDLSVLWDVNCKPYSGVTYRRESTKFPAIEEYGTIMIIYPPGEPPEILYRVSNCLITVLDHPAPTLRRLPLHPHDKLKINPHEI